MKNIFILAAILICSFWSSHSMAQEEQKGIHFAKTNSTTNILTMAKEQNKLVMVDCFTTWCGPCKKMSDEIFTLPEVGDYFNSHFVCYKLDMEKGEGPTKSKEWDINGYPTLIFLDTEGKVRFRIFGFRTADSLIQETKKYMESLPLSEIDIPADATSLTVKELASWNERFMKNGQHRHAQELIEKFIEQNPSVVCGDSILQTLFTAHVNNPYSRAFLNVWALCGTQAICDKLIEGMEDVWRRYCKTYYLLDNATGRFDGYDSDGMDKYEAFMREHGVTDADEYTMSYKLPGSFAVTDSLMLLDNLEKSASMPTISDSQWEYGRELLFKKLHNPTLLRRLDKAAKSRKKTIQKIKSKNKT